MRKTFLVPVFLWSLVAFAEESPQIRTCESYLTSEQHAVLQKATGDHFSWVVQSGFVEGKLRTVVHLGETHAKFERESMLGQEIITLFPAYGLEGVDLGRTWLGQVLGAPFMLTKKALAVFDKLNRQASVSIDAQAGGVRVVTVRGLSRQSPQKSGGALRKMARFIFYGRGSHQSTIQDAALRGRSRLQRYLNKLNEVANFLDLENIPSYELASYTILVGHQSLSGVDFLREIKNVEARIQEAPLDIDLEEGHQFSLVENLGSVLLPATLIACVYQLGGSTFQVGEAISHGTPFNDPASAESIEAWTTAGGILAGLVMALSGDRIFGKLDWGGRALTWTVDQILGRGRNLTMAKNIENTFRQNPSLGVLLVIAGKSHVNGVAQILSDSYGFKVVEPNVASD